MGILFISLLTDMIFFLAIQRCFSSLLKFRCKSILGCVFVYVGFISVLQISNKYSNYFIYNLLITVIGVSIICFLFYKGSIYEKIICIVSIILFSILSEMLISFLFFSIFSITYNEALDQPLITGFGSLFANLLTYILYSIYAMYRTNEKKFIRKGYLLAIFVICCGNIVIGIMIFSMYCNQPRSITPLIAIILLFAISIYLFVLYEKVVEYADYQWLAKTYQQEIKYYENYYNQLEENYDSIKKMRHDINNHLITIGMLAKKCKNTDIERYIDQVTNLCLDASSVVSTGNWVIDSILNYKIKKMNEYSIRFEGNIKIPSVITCDSSHLCALLGNAIDNAIDATITRDVSERFVSLNMKVDKGNLYVEVKNSFDGVIIQGKKGIVTTKKDKKNHGYGLRIMKELVEIYDGLVQTSAENGMFCIKLMLKQ